jgi:serine/threonine protein kinase
MNIVNRDVKPENLIVAPNLDKLTLIDFNVARVHQPGETTMMTKTGTPLFRAPEIINSLSYSNKVDIWAAGLVLYMLFSGGHHPFREESLPILMEKIQTAPIDFDLFKSGTDKDDQIVQLLKGMLNRDPDQRLTARECLDSQFIKSSLDL